MKTTKTKYETIRGRIHGAVKSARENHGFTKDRFVVDIGDEELTPELAAALARYNVDRSRYQIKQLVILHGDGAELTEISLPT